ncbi:MAG: lytic transglycosylase domain-containing protein [Bdellovibrionales bacterium]|nr:lytic transglycosylase domain-containing protein [Bdellovibrionales bacterium]
MSILRASLAMAMMVALGCHSTSLRSPPNVNENETQGRWFRDYKAARLLSLEEKFDDACKIFKALAADEKFPARKVAEMRAWETCAGTEPSQIDRSQVPSYMKDLALQVSLQLAQAQSDKPAELELASEKSKQRLTQTEKVKWIQLAIERAVELKQEDRIKDLNKRLYQIAPRLNPAPKEKDYLAVAADFRMARQFEKSRDYYERVIKGGARIEDKLTALKGLRLAAKNERRKDGHLESCARVVDFLRQALKQNPRSQFLRSASYDAQVHHARALWTKGQASEARAIFDRIEKTMKGRISLAELYWLKGRMAEEAQDFAAVSNFFSRALKERITDSALRDKILWYSAWNERRQGHYEAAAARLTDLDLKTQDEYLRVRALFWLGRSLADAKKDDEAKLAYEKVITLDPLGYYGLLAHKSLGLAITLKTNADSSTSGAGSTNLPLDTVLAEWLYLLDERDVMTALLDEASQAYKKQKDQNDEGWVAMFKFYAKAGLYMKLYESLSNLSPERRKSVLENHPELLFPQPWNEDVRTAALQFGVQEELLYAIMRQESAFDPRARSVADAFGLLQVLPEVAEKLATTYKIPYGHMEDLYTPRTNIQVGAAHVKELMEGHKGQFILAVAAYNANENAIRNWMKTRFRGDSLEFIEEIPYEETRVYVRLVMRNMIFYSLLKSKNASIEFPAWVLKLEGAG